MNEIFEKIYNDNNTSLNEDTALFEKVYTEAEMLNEMNPKLRALLAAGLIGTASLGAASCSMPTDDPTGYEMPAPETPSNPDNPDLDDSGDNNGGDEELTEEQRWAQTPFGQLGVTREDAARIANADILSVHKKITSNRLDGFASKAIIYIYENHMFNQYQIGNEISIAGTVYKYVPEDKSECIMYVVPDGENNEITEAFAGAIDAYNN